MPNYDFSESVVFITGASRGLGRSHAIHFAQNGADVAVADVGEGGPSSAYDLGTETDLTKTVEAVEQEGQTGLPVIADVRREEEIEHAVQKTLEELGPIDVLVNNAGIFNRVPMVEMDESNWSETINTNLKGTWLCAKHVGQQFVDRRIEGSIVNTSSVAGLVGSFEAGHYAASKHGIIGLTKSLALELAEHGINVNAVCPGAVATPMAESTEEAEGEEKQEEVVEFTGMFNVFGKEEVIQPSDVSEAVLWLSSDAARYVTGTSLVVDAGFIAK